jgi:hypothetical protein
MRPWPRLGRVSAKIKANRIHLDLLGLMFHLRKIGKKSNSIIIVGGAHRARDKHHLSDLTFHSAAAGQEVTPTDTFALRAEPQNQACRSLGDGPTIQIDVMTPILSDSQAMPLDKGIHLIVMALPGRHLTK